MKRLLIKWFPVIVITLLSIWAGKGLFKYYATSTHDGNHHIARSFDVITTLAEGHFPLRWAGTLNYFCGVPIYNFFYPLIYYIVALFYPLVKDVIQTLKLIDLATFFIGTFFFYLWIKKETKDKWVALSSAVLYLYAPYRFLLVFVRGSPEFMAYAILPIVLYFYAGIFEEKNFRRFVVLSFLAGITGGFLTISHNFTVMFLMPIILLFLLIKIFLTRKSLLKEEGLGGRFGKVAVIIFSFISAFGFGAFFIFPAIIEEKYTQLGTPRFLFYDHFPALWQLFRSKWDYFYSAQGTALDGMSFQLGYAHWVVLGLVGVWLLLEVFKIIRSRKDKGSEKANIFPNYIWIIVYFVLAVGSIYLMLDISMPVWFKIPLLQKIQFPWRILGISVFLISALFPFWLIKIKNKLLFWSILIAIPLLAFVGNRNHLLPQPVVAWEVHLYGDFEKLHYHRYTTTTFDNDILANDAKGTCLYETAPIDTESGRIDYQIVKKGSTFGSIKFQIDNPPGKNLVFGLGYFPGAYKFEINGRSVDYFDCEGRVCIDIKNTQKGTNLVAWKIVQTPIQSFFNKVTLAFIVIWLVILFLVFFKKRIKKHHLVFIGIFLVFAFFRFYNLDKRVSFGWDQERDSYAVRELLNGDIKLIGPRVLSDLGFFLPPYFFYLLAPFYKLTGGSPYSGALFLVFYSSIFFASAYWILNKVFNSKVALGFLVFWAVNPYILSIDVSTWNPILIPFVFVSLIFLQSKIFLLNKAAMSENYRWYGVLGILLAVGVSAHVQAILLAPVLIPFLFHKKRIRPILKKIGYLIAGFIIAFLPIFIFDLKNNFLNLRLIAQFITAGKNRDIGAFMPVWDNVVARMLGTSPGILISLLLFILVAIFLFTKRKEIIWRGLMYTWLSFPIFFAIYGSRPSEYYFNYLLVIVALVFGEITSDIIKEKQKMFRLAAASVLLVYFGYKSTEQLASANFGLYKKDKIVQYLSDITHTSPPFNISFSLGEDGDSGFRYLLDWHGVSYTKNPSDPLIQLEKPPKKSSDFIIESVGIEIPWEK